MATLEQLEANLSEARTNRNIFRVMGGLVIAGALGVAVWTGVSVAEGNADLVTGAMDLAVLAGGLAVVPAWIESNNQVRKAEDAIPSSTPEGAQFLYYLVLPDSVKVLVALT